MVEIRMRYEGDLHCLSVHGPSGSELPTDAPKDNQGRGESYSPTDLVATALGTCILTTMGIVARKNGWNMDGASATVEKSMIADPLRRIARLEVKVRMPEKLEAAARATLEKTAETCPVQQSISSAIQVPMVFEWGATSAAPRAP
jgi:putative redox protein